MERNKALQDTVLSDGSAMGGKLYRAKQIHGFSRGWSLDISKGHAAA